MNIIGECFTPEGDFGDDFLMELVKSQHAMKSAADAMLKCSQVAKSEDARKRYATTHKAMVRLIREWNALEQTRNR